MDNILTIKEYIKKGTFVIPNYQRGYKWSVTDLNKEKESSASHFVNSIIDAYIRNDKDYFIEAVTVVEKNNEIIIIDGQQRTTTLYLLLIKLGCFEILESFTLNYKVREDSDNYLKQLLINKDLSSENNIDDTQDVFYFKNALNTIESLLNSRDENNNLRVNCRKILTEYVMTNVKLLYNVISEKKAITTFMSLNGLKAQMKDEELIKSDLLIKSSRQESGSFDSDKDLHLGIEWKIKEDRSRMAQNWDKWLYWWNNENVRNYYNIGNKHPLYYLLITYWHIHNKDKAITFCFESFKTQFLTNSIQSKKTFEGLRKLQKTFEDYYNKPEIYNYLGIILKTSSQKEIALRYFLKKESADFTNYAKWTLVDATHNEIINKFTENKNNEEVKIKEKKAIKAIDLVSEKYVYWDENNEYFKDDRFKYANRFLMLLNLIEDNKLQRKFDFTIWDNRSLEHIFPKSKNDRLHFDNDHLKEGSVHCIGNLVLLYGVNNSSFRDKDFLEKKEMYFNIATGLTFQSRNLLHTISVFANSEWSEEQIVKNKNKTINLLKNLYGI